jgi:hypothetical protein
MGQNIKGQRSSAANVAMRCLRFHLQDTDPIMMVVQGRLHDSPQSVCSVTDKLRGQQSEKEPVSNEIHLESVRSQAHDEEGCVLLGNLAPRWYC